MAETRNDKLGTREANISWYKKFERYEVNKTDCLKDKRNTRWVRMWFVKTGVLF